MYSSNNHQAMNQYQQIGTRNTVSDSSPHRLIQMMMEHAITQMNHARGHITRGEIEAKGRTIGKAISIINGLQASLNHSANSQMSDNFDALYTYMMRRLLEANLNDDVAIVDEIAGLLSEIKEAWDAIADEPEVLASVSTSIHEEDDHGANPS